MVWGTSLRARSLGVSVTLHLSPDAAAPNLARACRRFFRRSLSRLSPPDKHHQRMCSRTSHQRASAIPSSFVPCASSSSEPRLRDRSQLLAPRTFALLQYAPTHPIMVFNRGLHSRALSSFLRHEPSESTTPRWGRNRPPSLFLWLETAWQSSAETERWVHDNKSGIETIQARAIRFSL